MDKSRVCMSRTINLAKQKCPKKTNLLVYESSGQKSKPRPGQCAAPSISTPQPTKIRICTGAELKKMCRPVPCTCPPKRNLGFLGVLMQLLGLGVKSLVAGSLIYYTWEAGLWGDSDDTEEFYTNMCHLITHTKPVEKKLSESCEADLDLMNVPPPPEDKCRRPPISNERSLYKVKETWNHVVTTIFEACGGFPHNFIAWITKPKEERQCTPVKKK